jgi:GNAT superfamily N-acetyltransferase
MNRVKIRPGLKADLTEVTALWRDLVHYHVERDDRISRVAPKGAEKWRARLAQLLDDPTCCLYVAEAAGERRLIGFVTGFLRYEPEVFQARKSGHIGDLFVAPDWRRQRVGRRLLAALTRWFQDEGVDHLEVNMVSRNPAAVDFWRAMGGEAYMVRMWMPVNWQVIDRGSKEKA